MHCRSKPWHSLPGSLIILLLALFLTVTSAALIDTGDEAVTTPSTKGGSAKTKEIPEPAKSSQDRQNPSTTGTSQSSLILPNEDRLITPRGCRRTSDFVGQVCQAPYDAASGDSTKPKITADLLICDLPQPEPLIKSSQDPPEHGGKTFAISGTITVTQPGPGSNVNQDRLELQAINGLSPGKDSQPGVHIDDDRKASSVAYPGPEDEGFWRQRNGEYEWHPSSGTDGQSNVHANAQTTSQSAHESNAQDLPSKPSIDREDTRLREYDAWSAERGDESFLSFSEWKQRYLEEAQGKHGNQDSSAVSPSPSKPKDESRTKPAPETPTTAELTSTQPSDSSVQQNFASASSTERKADVPPPSSSTSNTERSGGSRSAATHQSSDSAQSVSSEAPLDHSAANDPRPDLQEETKDPLETLKTTITAADASAQLSKLKHRWNFASLDCAAVVHRTNPTAKFASSILSEKKDRYMLSPCPRQGSKTLETSQFVIVELCEEIKIDTLVLANYEFFSSMFKKFRVTAARRLTGRDDDWTELGTFRARNVRGQQVFRIPSASRSERFFRYVRIDFLEHFGSEYYCPVSLLRVYGLTQMEEFNREFGEPDSGTELDQEQIKEITDVPEGVAVPAAPSRIGVSIPSASDSNRSTNSIQGFTARDEDVWRKHEQLFQQRIRNESLAASIGDKLVPSDLDDTNTTGEDEQAQAASLRYSESRRPVHGAATASSHIESGFCPANLSGTSKDNNETSMCASDLGRLRPLFAEELAENRFGRKSQEEAQAHVLERVTKERASDTDDRDQRERMDRKILDQPRAAPDGNRNAGPKKLNVPPPPHPPSAGSESVYRAIFRRLSALEANATLSHSYIEHSGQMLREVFARMEKRQEARMSDMLRALNGSNWNQIEALKRRQQVDLQRTIFEFDVHRQQADSERLALLREVHLLAEEVLLEKRLSIAQLVLLLVVFVFVGLTRGSRTVPFIHSGIAKIGRGSLNRKGRNAASIPKTEGHADHARAIQSSYASPTIDSTTRGRPATNVPPGQFHPNGILDEYAPQSRRSPSKIRLGSPLKPRRISFGENSTLVADKTSPLPRSPLRSPSKLPTPKHGSSVKSARLRSRGDSAVNLMTDQALKARLISLLKTLEALESRPNPDRPGKVAPGLEDEIAKVSRTSGDPTAMIRSVTPRRHPHQHKSNMSTQTNSAIQSRQAFEPHAQAAQERLYVDNHDRGAGQKIRIHRDDGMGMSSDWTEKSETEEASEAGAVFTDEDVRNTRPVPPSAPFREVGMKSESAAPAVLHPSVDRKDLVQTADASSISGSHIRQDSDSTQHGSFPIQRPHDTQLERLESQHSSRENLPKLDVHISSSESESEGGVWQRVLPRRIGNGSGSRRSQFRYTNNDINGRKETRTSARGSPVPGDRMSHISDRHANKSAKPHTPDSIKRLWGRAASSPTPDQFQQRRSETPDTIRGNES